MKQPPLRLSPVAAFSLPEVTISMGIVAVLMLPALAMLAGGGSIERLARDRETASRIARAMVSGARGGETGDHYLIDFSGERSVRVDLPTGDTEKTIYALFDKKGLFLGEVGEGGYERGIDPAGGGVHLVRLRLTAEEEVEGLLEWDLSVEQPAAASREVRDAEVFQTRLAIP